MLVYFNKTKDTYHLPFSQAGQISFEHSEALTQSPPLHRDLYLNDFEDLALCFQPENIKNKNTLTIVEWKTNLGPDLEKVFNVPRILNLPFSNVPHTIKFGSKVRRNNENLTVRCVCQWNNILLADQEQNLELIYIGCKLAEQTKQSSNSINRI